MRKEEIETIIENETLESLDIDTINIFAYDKKELKKYIKTSKTPYSNILTVLIHSQLSETTAKHVWKDIVKHLKKLEKQLHRKVGIIVATVDYMHNIKKTKSKLKIISEDNFDSISEIATKDELTKLYDRDVLEIFLEKVNEKAIREKSNYSFMMFDIDDFKVVNDTHGHQKGDEVLAKISDILTSNIRKMDIAFRYGGEELCAIFPDANKDQAYEIAEKIRKKIQEEYENSLKTTVSVGVCDNSESNDTQDIIKKADELLYEAKESGKNKTIKN
ncbi:MAG: GGDEF domain-containing protein [Campylobacterota bacterium]